MRALRGYHQTPKDDLESLAISLLEMHLGACVPGQANSCTPACTPAAIAPALRLNHLPLCLAGVCRQRTV